MLDGLLTTVGADLTAEITAALGVAIPVAVGLLGAVVGWKTLRRFVKS